VESFVFHLFLPSLTPSLPSSSTYLDVFRRLLGGLGSLGLLLGPVNARDAHVRLLFLERKGGEGEGGREGRVGEVRSE